ncbi:MAG: hypothetical protein WC485_11280 [Opitutaceae bacterium]
MIPADELALPQYATGDEFGNYFETCAPTLEEARERYERRVWRREGPKRETENARERLAAK